MALIDDIISDVYVITNRPDLVSDTLVAVKTATLKLHQSDFYAKDLHETGLEFAEPAYLQSLAYRDLFPSWRKLSYLRKYEYTSGIGAPGEFFEILTPEQVLDSYGIQKENVVYVAGENLEIRSNTEDQYVLIGCYLNPILTTVEYNSWIAKDHPYAVVFEAARIIFAGIGLQERAAQIREQVAEQMALIRSSNI